MPELPEVETIRRQAEQALIDESITRVEVREKKNLIGESSYLIGKKITKVERVGKYLFIYLEGGAGLQVHLKMTGRLVLNDEWYFSAPHTRVVIELASGKKLYYWDTRKFGYLKVERKIKEALDEVKKRLGKEPWEMGANEFYLKLKKTDRAVKNAILDQSLVAGVGNIYANDALWKAGIDPRRAGKIIKKKEAENLLTSIREVMERSIKIGGASDNTFRDLRGKPGEYQNEFLVYGKTKGKCLKCGRDLIYLKIGGRGTWWCEKCQK